MPSLATSSLTESPRVRLSVFRISSLWVRPISESNCWFTACFLFSGATLPAKLFETQRLNHGGRGNNNESALNHPQGRDRVEQVGLFQVQLELHPVPRFPVI